ncbi:MAG: cell wall hydrolase [Bacillota bacterium]|nr:cell wall hydrolase [Bacillota bacterium]
MSKKFKFNLILVFVVCLLCALCCGSALADEAEESGYPEAPVYVDGMLSCRGYVINGDVYVSLESVCGILGHDAKTDYDTDTNNLTVSVAGIDITVGAGDNYMCANGRYLYLSSGYYEINGSAVFPVDAVAKIFSLSISRNEENGGVDFGTANEAILMSGDEFYNEDDLYWMSRIITWESGNQPVAGQIAVGNVVLNRVDSERFPNSIKEVIFQTGQFSPAMNGVIYGDPYEISVVCAKLALEGYNTVGDALFFQVGRYGAVADIATYVCTIGGHNFFK